MTPFPPPVVTLHADPGPRGPAPIPPGGRPAAELPEGPARRARPDPAGAPRGKLERSPPTAPYLVSDEELIRLVAAGRAPAFEALYDRHCAAALRLAQRIVGSRLLAEDVVQEAFLSVWRAAARYRPQLGSPRTWVLAIVHHRAIDTVRRVATRERGRLSAAALEDRADVDAQTDAEALRRHDRRAVQAALDRLPRPQRTVLAHLYFGGLSQAELAAALNVPLGTIKGRKRLGLSKLRTELADRVVA